jgi:hypothetical protein
VGLEPVIPSIQAVSHLQAIGSPADPLNTYPDPSFTTLEQTGIFKASRPQYHVVHPT